MPNRERERENARASLSFNRRRRRRFFPATSLVFFCIVSRSQFLSCTSNRPSLPAADFERQGSNRSRWKQTEERDGDASRRMLFFDRRLSTRAGRCHDSSLPRKKATGQKINLTSSLSLSLSLFSFPSLLPPTSTPTTSRSGTSSSSARASPARPWPRPRRASSAAGATETLRRHLLLRRGGFCCSNATSTSQTASWESCSSPAGT